MKVFYDSIRNNISLNGIGRFFSNGSLEAIEVSTNYIGIRYLNQVSNILYGHFSEFQKEDGSSAGTNISSVLNYLNTEFSITQSSSNSLPIVSTDPSAPILGQGWILETVINPSGTLQALVGGFPIVTQQNESLHQLSYNTTDNIIKRVILT